MTDITIAVDAMGGDIGPSVTIPSGINAMASQPKIRIIFVGNESAIKAELAKLDSEKYQHRFSIVHASEEVTMDDPPAIALRQKKDSSMRVALNLVKSGDAMACISAGNTGALMAISRFVLKTVPGIDRPAIVTRLPSIDGFTYVLDLGANVDSDVEHLFQFAVMGTILSKSLGGIDNPTVGLLNVGAEEIKGTQQVKAAHKRLQETSLNYIGYVEGDEAFVGNTDVVVCDGFAGNISLKTCEGIAKLGMKTFKRVLTGSLWGKIIGLLGRPLFKQVADLLDPKSYNGATLIGLRRTVVKSHGGADITAYTFAINNAYQQTVQNIPELIQSQITELVEQHD